MVAAIAYFMFQAASAGYDFFTLRIPNILPLGLGLLFLSTAAPNAPNVDWTSHIGSAVLVFVIGSILFRLRMLGGGDVKLLSATALWAGFTALPLLILVMAIFGAVLAVMQRVMMPLVFGVLATYFYDVRIVRNFVSRPDGVPYGVAIAGAGLLAMYKYPPAWLFLT